MGIPLGSGPLGSGPTGPGSGYSSMPDNDGNAHFLCHFGVIRSQRETAKLRVVFD